MFFKETRLLHFLFCLMSALFRIMDIIWFNIFNVYLIYIYIMKGPPFDINEHIHHLIYLSLFFMRTFKFYSLSKFYLQNIMFFIVVSMFYIRSSELIHLIAESLYPFTNLPISPPWLPAPGNHFSLLCFYVFSYSMQNNPSLKWFW